MMLAQLRHYGYVLEDPLLDSWLQGWATGWARPATIPQQRYTFFMMRTGRSTPSPRSAATSA
jgi:predicted Zn-dependent protease